MLIVIPDIGFWEDDSSWKKKHYRCIFASWWLLRSPLHTNVLHKHKLLFEVTKQPRATALQTESFRNKYFFSQGHISRSLISTLLSLLAAATVEYCQNPFPAVPWFSFSRWAFPLPFLPVLFPGSQRNPSQSTCCHPLNHDKWTGGSATPVSMDCSVRTAQTLLQLCLNLCLKSCLYPSSLQVLSYPLHRNQ